MERACRDRNFLEWDLGFTIRWISRVRLQFEFRLHTHISLVRLLAGCEKSTREDFYADLINDSASFDQYTDGGQFSYT
jgi:hypothetical protein